MKKIFLNRLVTGILVPLVSVLMVYLFWNPNKAIYIIPNSSPDFYAVNTYCDSINNPENASSILYYHATDTSLSFRYQLGKGNPHPFAGISIQAKENGYFNLSSYDRLNLTIHATEGKRIQILIGAYSTGFTKTENTMSYRYLVKDLDLIKNQSNYTIMLDEFSTATWWYSNNHVSEKDLGNVEFDKIKLINIQNCQILGTNIPDTILLTELKFTKNTNLFYWTCLIFIGLYYISWAFLHYFKKSPKESIQKVEIHYNPVATIHQSEEDLQKIIFCISSNYQDSELSLRKIQLSTGISESKVSTLLKEKFNLAFKQYLNQLRLNEAKRLLHETELPISDIAYKVGYGNISHFNRVFKEAEETSPNDYRKKIKA